jgi:hypothetical protein
MGSSFALLSCRCELISSGPLDISIIIFFDSFLLISFTAYQTNDPLNINLANPISMVRRIPNRVLYRQI